jgi:hypothetical protein
VLWDGTDKSFGILIERKIGMGSSDLPQSPQLPKLLEPAELFAYYRRCQRFRKNAATM